jgi:hypothetical protein
MIMETMITASAVGAPAGAFLSSSSISSMTWDSLKEHPEQCHLCWLVVLSSLLAYSGITMMVQWNQPWQMADPQLQTHQQQRMQIHIKKGSFCPKF